MADSSPGNSDQDIDLDFPPTQTDQQILDEIRRKYGGLPRSEFATDMSNTFSVEDLMEFRRSLYDLAQETVPETPSGTMMVRKDTQNSGGKPASAKLADDIYVLLQFHEGDKNMDITKLLTEKSRRLLQDRRTSIFQHEPTQRGDDAHSHDAAVTGLGVTGPVMPQLHEFCRDILVEMRKDRNLIQEMVSDISRQIGVIPTLERDIRDLRSDFLSLTQKVAALENRGNTVERSHGELDKRVRHLTTVEQSTEQQRINLDRNISDLRHMYGSATSRLNNLDLITAQLARSMGATNRPGCPVSEHTNQRPSTNPSSGHEYPTRNCIPPAQTRSNDADTRNTDHAANPGTTNNRQDPDQTFVKSVHQGNVPLLKSRPTQDIVDVIHADTANHTKRKVTLSEDTPFSITVQGESPNRQYNDRGSNRDVNQNTGNHQITGDGSSDKGTTIDNTSDELTGFTPTRHKRRDKYSSVFVAGIVLKNNSVKETIDSIYRYINKRKIECRGVWKIKESGITMSAKILITRDRMEGILTDGFWPKGIICREWIDRTDP